MQYLTEQERFRTWLAQPQLRKNTMNLGLTHSFRYEGVDVQEGTELLKPKSQYRYLTKAKYMSSSGIKLELEIRRSLTRWNCKGLSNLAADKRCFKSQVLLNKFCN